MRHFLIFLALLFAVPALAQDAAPDTTSEAATQLQSIYTSTQDFKDVTVSIENGVATLGGEIANAALAEKAVSIAEGQDGVIYVQDRIDRVLVASPGVESSLDEAGREVRSILRAWPAILAALLAFIFFWWLGGLVSRNKGLWQKIAPNPFLGELLSQTARVLFIVGGLVIALNLLGAQGLIATILGGAGVLGLAIGFAIRDPLENYFASIMLSLRQPFRKGDHVKIDAHEGKVVRLTSRATILMTADGNHLRVPNAQVFKAVILNYTTNPERRITFRLPTREGDDPVLAIEAGLAALRKVTGVEDDPAPSALIVDAAGGGATLEFAAWVNQKSADAQKVRSLAIRAVENALSDPKRPKKAAARTLDVRPDAVIDAKVAEDNGKAQNNLLDDDKPVE